jgi:D-serine deaminase-like pyridoxal phosphate-dependent protein
MTESGYDEQFRAACREAYLVSRREQGLPDRVEDPEGLRRLAELFSRPEDELDVLLSRTRQPHRSRAHARQSAAVSPPPEQEEVT